MDLLRKKEKSVRQLRITMLELKTSDGMKTYELFKDLFEFVFVDELRVCRVLVNDLVQALPHLIFAVT